MLAGGLECVRLLRDIDGDFCSVVFDRVAEWLNTFRRAKNVFLLESRAEGRGGVYLR